MTSEEFTGSLGFIQFWLDTIAEWEKDTGKHPLIGLYATKDVTDAILADAPRAAVVDVIYNRFGEGNSAGWWYQPNGKLYAPTGGQNLSPRQWYRQEKPANLGAAEIAKAVNEYRTKYPDKPFVYVGGNDPHLAWTTLMAGGSMPSLRIADARLATQIASMKPTATNLLTSDAAALAYASTTAPIRVNLHAGMAYAVRIIDPKTGDVVETRPDVVAEASTEIAPPTFAPYAVWLEETK
jgi:hypothetical protein